VKSELRAFISSTSLDLKEHRRLAMNACLGCGILPIMMEFEPFPADALTVSLKMTRTADIYIGIFGRRYGYVPEEKNPRNLSITAMEYEWAVRRDIPREVFLMADSHLTDQNDWETEQRGKVMALHERVKAENIVTYFSSPIELREQIFVRLSAYRATIGVPTSSLSTNFVS